MDLKKKNLDTEESNNLDNTLARSQDELIPNVGNNRNNYLEFYDKEIKKKIKCLNEDVIGKNKPDKINGTNNGIEKIQKNLFSMDNFISLQKLYLSNNYLEKLDGEIFEPLENNLIVLDISSNLIKELPEEIFGKLTKLEVLDLSNNKLTSLKENIFKNLNELKKLSVSTNLLQNGFPENIFSNIKNLEYLNISNNNLSELPEKIFENLTKLIELRISSNKIESFGDHFKNLSSLEKLYLSHNLLKSIDILNLNTIKLKNLDLSHNKIKDIDESNGGKLNKKLEILNLFFNQIECAKFKDFSSLEVLNLSSNKLTILEFICWSQNGSLKSLKLNNNKISSLKQIMLNKQIKLNDETINSKNIFSNEIKIYLNQNYLHNDLDLKWFDDKLGDKKFEIHLYDNEFSNSKLNEIERKSNNDKQFKIKLYSPLDDGYISEIAIDKSITFPQLKGFKWSCIPMLAVLIGENGMGKSSILKFIHQKLQIYYKKAIDETNFELKFNKSISSDVKLFPLLIKVNDKIEKICDSSYFKEILETDPSYILAKNNLLQKDNNKDDNNETNNDSFIDQACIFSFSTIEEALTFTRNDFDLIKTYLKNENFKYNVIQMENREFFLMIQGKDLRVEINCLSPGEQLILLLLLWKFIFERYEIYGKTILCFDEPDAHVHISFIPKMVELLEKLAKMGVQIIITSHNMLTIDSFNESNVFYIDNIDDLEVKKCNYSITNQILGNNSYIAFKKENKENARVLENSIALFNNILFKYSGDATENLIRAYFKDNLIAKNLLFEVLNEPQFFDDKTESKILDFPFSDFKSNLSEKNVFLKSIFNLDEIHNSEIFTNEDSIKDRIYVFWPDNKHCACWDFAILIYKIKKLLFFQVTIRNTKDKLHEKIKDTLLGDKSGTDTLPKDFPPKWFTNYKDLIKNLTDKNFQFKYFMIHGVCKYNHPLKETIDCNKIEFTRKKYVYPKDVKNNTDINTKLEGLSAELKENYVPTKIHNLSLRYISKIFNSEFLNDFNTEIFFAKEYFSKIDSNKNSFKEILKEIQLNGADDDNAVNQTLKYYFFDIKKLQNIDFDNLKRNSLYVIWIENKSPEYLLDINNSTKAYDNGSTQVANELIFFRNDQIIHCLLCLPFPIKSGATSAFEHSFNQLNKVFSLSKFVIHGFNPKGNDRCFTKIVKHLSSS